MTLILLLKLLSSKSNWTEINSNFQTSDLESSPTEETGSVNFLSDDLVTIYWWIIQIHYIVRGLNNSGIVDYFPNPHNYDGDTTFEIEDLRRKNMKHYIHQKIL